MKTIDRKPGSKIKVTPAPWKLSGTGYILILKRPSETTKNEVQIDNRGLSFLSMPILMYVNYTASDVGPYHELLYIPGRVETSDGSFWNISKIVVSSEESVISGRANWGIPKSLASFQVSIHDGMQRIIVKEKEKVVMRLNLTPGSFHFPVNTSWLPSSLFTLQQSLNHLTYRFAPSARGNLSPASIQCLVVEPGDWPALTEKDVFATLQVQDFSMVFPESQQF